MIYIILDIDHRNLISLTGSPALGNGKNNDSLNGNDNFRQMPPQPLLDVPMSHQFNNFMVKNNLFKKCKFYKKKNIFLIREEI